MKTASIRAETGHNKSQNLSPCHGKSGLSRNRRKLRSLRLKVRAGSSCGGPAPRRQGGCAASGAAPAARSFQAGDALAGGREISSHTRRDGGPPHATGANLSVCGLLPGLPGPQCTAARPRKKDARRNKTHCRRAWPAARRREGAGPAASIGKWRAWRQGNKGSAVHRCRSGKEESKAAWVRAAQGAQHQAREHHAAPRAA